jgi:DHA2 family lincomycin resistance protein-like MFS transporter
VVSIILIALLFMSLLGAAAILLPLFLQTVLGEGTFWTGLAVLPGGLVLGLLGRPVGAIYDKVGARPLVIPGSIMMAVALWLFTLLGAGSSLGAVVGIHVLLMAGLGLMMTPLMTEGLSSLPGSLYSHGSAILATLQQVAGAFGTAAFVTISAIASASLGGTPDAQGLRVGFMAAGVIGVLAVIVSLFMGGKPAVDDGAAGAAWAGPDSVDTVPADAPARGPVVPSGGAGAGTVVRGQVDLAGPGEAVVTLVDEHGAQHGRAGTRNGDYEIALPSPGAWLLVVSAPGHAPHAARLVAQGSGSVLTHDVSLPVAAEPASPGPVSSRREPEPAAGA